MTSVAAMPGKSERLAALSDAEQYTLYGLPDVDDGQQLECCCDCTPYVEWSRCT